MSQIFRNSRSGDDGINQDAYQQGGYGANRSGSNKPYGNNGGYGGSKGGYGVNGYNGGYNKPNGFQNRTKQFEETKSQDDVPRSNHQSYDSDDFKLLRENLNDVDYSQIQLPPFQKIFIQPGKSTIQNDEEIQNYLKEKGIIIRSKHADVPKPFLTWPETKFPKYIMQVIEESQFQDPMPIQAQSFPIILSGHDLIGVAQTGSGKTLSFMLPALVHINAQDPVKSGEGPIVLVISPTRELANQIQEECNKFGSRCKISSVCVFGGSPKFLQENELRRGCDVVIATPGRLIDFLAGKVIDLKRVTYLVLDEADRMLDMGFEPSIRKIVGQIRPDRQTVMFSATWPQSVRKLALDFCNSNPIHIQIGSMEKNVNKDIEQIVEVMAKEQKYPRLKELLLSMTRFDKTIIFTQTKKDCDNLSEALAVENIRNACINGDKSQRERDKVIDLFKTGRINTLVATDIISRGLDVKDIKLVVNFDFPKQMEDYIHRIGRTGRAGATGKAISFISTQEDKLIVQELIDLLRQSNQVVTQELQELVGNARGVGLSGGFRRGGYGGQNKFSGNTNGRFNNNNNRDSSQGQQSYKNQGTNRGTYGFTSNQNQSGNYQGNGFRNGGYANSYNKDFQKRENNISFEQGETRQIEGFSENLKKIGFFTAKKE